MSDMEVMMSYLGNGDPLDSMPRNELLQSMDTGLINKCISVLLIHLKNQKNYFENDFKQMTLASRITRTNLIDVILKLKRNLSVFAFREKPGVEKGRLLRRLERI